MNILPLWKVAAAVALVSFVGCKSNQEKAKPAASASAATANTAAASGKAAAGACGDYVAALDACIAKMPEGQRDALTKTRDAQKKALATAPAAAKAQMQSSCSTGLASLKQNPLCK